MTLTSGELADVRRRTEEKIDEVQRKIDDLMRMRETLEDLARSCEGHGPVTDCPILDAIAHEEDVIAHEEVEI